VGSFTNSDEYALKEFKKSVDICQSYGKKVDRLEHHVHQAERWRA